MGKIKRRSDGNEIPRIVKSFKPSFEIDIFDTISVTNYVFKLDKVVQFTQKF